MCMFASKGIDMTGGHWIAIYADDDGYYGEHFDSMGFAPTRVF